MTRRRLGVALGAAILVSAASALPASAHVVQQFGPYTIAIGWAHEPAYVGTENAVQVIVKDGGKPVDDLGAGDLKVAITAVGQTSAALSLDPSFDPDTGLGTPGEYLAPIIPTLPGDYSFHLTGAIHGQAVDASFTSSDTTFDAVQDPTTAQFPAREPTLTELSTRAGRLDGRVQAAMAAASQATDDANRALIVGSALGGLGLLVGLVALILAYRRRRTA